jgi:mannose-1-phosphate guanylyltransferase
MSLAGIERPSPWALVLAGGDGRRLRRLTRRIAGDERPKQFCRLLDQDTLLEQTLRRSALLIPRERTVTVVVEAHERFYAPLLAGTPPLDMAIQPENRGTAPAILYGLLRIMAAAPVSPVVVIPSDHYVSNDAAFMAHVETATRAAAARPDLVVLLGVMPDSTDVEDGWIEPGERIAGPWRPELHRARHWWERPSPRLAVSLRARGCLWDSFVMVAYPSAVLTMIRRAVPSLVDAFAPVRMRLQTPWEAPNLRRVYARLPSIDFAQRVVGACPANLAVLCVDDVAWSDLGAPAQVTATLARSGARPVWVGDREARAARGAVTQG